MICILHGAVPGQVAGFQDGAGEHGDGAAKQWGRHQRWGGVCLPNPNRKFTSKKTLGLVYERMTLRCHLLVDGNWKV